MKKMILSIVGFITLIIDVHAEDTILSSPFTLGGFTGASFTEGVSPTNTLHAGDVSFNFRPILTYRLNEEWSIFSEVEFAWLGEERNWIQELGMQYRVNDNWKIQFGRTSSSMIYATPPPRFNPTVVYPRFFHGLHNTGLKVIGDYEDWNFYFNVGGNSSVWFADSQAFSRIETDLRLKYKPSENSFVAFGAQLNNQSQRYEVDFGYDQGGLHLGGALMYSSGDFGNQISAWSLATYDITNSIEGQLLWDYLEDSGSSLVTGLTWSLDENIDFTAGYQFAFDKKAPSGLSLRFRKRF